MVSVTPGSDSALKEIKQEDVPASAEHWGPGKGIAQNHSPDRSQMTITVKAGSTPSWRTGTSTLGSACKTPSFRLVLTRQLSSSSSRGAQPPNLVWEGH